MNKNHEDNKILQDAINTPERVSLLEAKRNMDAAVKSNSSLTGLAKIQFLKKQKKYKDQQAAKEEGGGEENGQQQQQQQQQPARAGTRAHARNTIIQFFKNNISKSAQGYIKIGQKKTTTNYEDLLEDLVTNNRTRPDNLNTAETNAALSELARLGMPAAWIRSTKLRKKYNEVRNRQASAQAPSTSQATPVRVPQSTLGKITRARKRDIEGRKKKDSGLSTPKRTHRLFSDSESGSDTGSVLYRGKGKSGKQRKKTSSDENDDSILGDIKTGWKSWRDKWFT